MDVSASNRAAIDMPSRRPNGISSAVGFGAIEHGHIPYEQVMVDLGRAKRSFGCLLFWVDPLHASARRREKNERGRIDRGVELDRCKT